MCTITYIPQSSGYIVTQNRDESPKREKAVFPIEETANQPHLFYPKDPEGNGSWFVTTNNGQTICIMNAKFHFDKTSADFKHSRGLVPLHFVQFQSVEQFVKDYEFEGIQGFTLIVADNRNIHKVHWDEERALLKTYSPRPLIFQSNPLYNPELKRKRIQWFNQWLAKNNHASILDFHTYQDAKNKAESILMDREIVKTISVTQHEFSEKSAQLKYAEVENLKKFKKIIIR